MRLFVLATHLASSCERICVRTRWWQWVACPHGMLPGPSVRLRLTGEEWPAAAVENGNVSPVRTAGPRGVARGRAAPESGWLRWTRATGCGAQAQERERGLRGFLCTGVDIRAARPCSAVRRAGVALVTAQLSLGACPDEPPCLCAECSAPVCLRLSTPLCFGMTRRRPSSPTPG